MPIERTYKDEVIILKRNLKAFQGSQSVEEYASRIGLSAEYLKALLESSRANPTLKTLCRVSQKLGCSVTELLTDL